MERLAALEGGVGGVPTIVKPAATPQTRTFKTFFGIGLIVGLCVGAAALMALPLLLPDDTPVGVAAEAAVTAREKISAADVAAAVPTFAVSVHRMAAAPLALRVAGIDPADRNYTILISDVPEPARLSKGERRDEHTWALSLADLDGLQLTLGKDTPDAFDLTIELAAADGTSAGRSVARVRVLEASQRTADDSSPLPPPAARAATIDTPFRTDTRAASRPAVAASPPRAPEPPATIARRTVPMLPGASGLGMSTTTVPSDDRQLWWKMPLPTWAPFGTPGR